MMTMTVAAQIKEAAFKAFTEVFADADIQASMIAVNQTKPEFDGDYTIVLFPFLKTLRMKPAELGAQIGDYLVANNSFFESYTVVAGFLNLTIKDSFWASFLQTNVGNKDFGKGSDTGKNVMVEYSSPNTNKPLHFGHMRNIFLGYAMSNILDANGNHVIKANLINDRGIHICKSMLAWMHFGNGATPESTGMKGDKLVGDYYVKFNDAYKAQIKELVAGGMEEAKAEKQAPLMKEAQEMLLKWEQGDEETVSLWKKMNGWVYDGFHVSYERLGVDFDKMYYESNTYLLGKSVVEKGLQSGVLFKKEDGSVWIDLTDEGLDQKLLLRADGTSVYITQDIGTAIEKYNDFNLDKSIYVIGDEQNYHMQVLKLILKKMGDPCADGIHHLSYGMVELPTGRMKSREGTVVDADDMMDEMVALAQKQTEEAGKTQGFTQEELNELYNTIGMGALKFYLLRVDPKKKMIFNPEESIDLHGFTATFIQYAHARICSILRKEGLSIEANAADYKDFEHSLSLTGAEKKIIVSLEQYPTILANACDEYNPSLLCNYTFQVAQEFNSFYSEHSIANAENEEKKQLRLMLILFTAQVMHHAMGLLGIKLPTKM